MMCRAALASGGARCFDNAEESYPQVSPDGKWLAYGIAEESGGVAIQKIRVWPLGEGQAKTLNVRGPLLAGFTPDSRAILFREGPYRNEIWIAPLDGSEPKRLADLQIPSLGDLAVSPDGKSLLSVQGVSTGDVVIFRGIH
jgi:hypothetical protein